jgi:hypothetical protein
MLCKTCIFASSMICESHSALGCVRGAKHRRTIFHAPMGPVRILSKAQWDESHQTCIFLHPVQSVGQLVHFGASEVLGWARCASHEKRIGEQYTKLVFLHLVRSVGHIVCSGASEVQNVNALFSCSGGPMWI